MRLIVYRAAAPFGVASAILAGLLMNLLAPQEVAIWFGIAAGLTAVGATVIASLRPHHTPVVVALAASASSVASGQAGIATMGALAGLAVIAAVWDIRWLGVHSR